MMFMPSGAAQWRASSRVYATPYFRANTTPAYARSEPPARVDDFRPCGRAADKLLTVLGAAKAVGGLFH